MSHTARIPRSAWRAWIAILSLLFLLVLTNLTAFLMYCFSNQTTFLWVYGDGVWGGVIVQAILIGLLLFAGKQVRRYHALTELAYVEKINELLGEYSSDAPGGDSGDQKPSSPNPTN
jgi:hypothetical protein